MSVTDSNGPLPYLKYCGIEVANAARTVAYLRNGLGDTSQGKWELGDGDMCGALHRDDGYTDIVFDFEAGIAGWTSTLQGGGSVPASLSWTSLGDGLVHAMQVDATHPVSAFTQFRVYKGAQPLVLGGNPVANADAIPVVAGRKYVVQTRMRVTDPLAAPTQAIGFVLYFFAADGTLISTSAGGGDPTPFDTLWHTYRFLPITAPANAVYAAIGYHFTSSTAGDVIQFLAEWVSLTEQTEFISPASDSAPWYDASEPGSESFLGVVLLDFKGYDSVGKRAVTPQLSGLGGGSFGKKRRDPRKLTFRAALVSADGAGAEYGLRWLTSVLGSPSCDDCGGCDATFRLLCPPSDGTNDSLGKWTSYDTVLTDGPHEVEPWLDRRHRIDADILAGCRDFVIVEWEMTAGNPWLYKQPSLVNQFTMAQSSNCTDICSFLNGTPGSAHCTTITPPKIGTIAPVFVMHSTLGIGSIILEAYDTCPQPEPSPALVTHIGGRSTLKPRIAARRHGLGPQTRLTAALVERGQRFLVSSKLRAPSIVATPAPPAARTITIDNIPAGTTIVVDSAQRKVVAISDADGSMSDATHLVDDSTGTGVQWFDFSDCDSIGCVCARIAEPCAAGIVDVSLYTQTREG